MSVELIVEDGIIKNDANTFISLENFQAWLKQRDPEYEPAAGEADTEASALIRSCDVLNSYSWKGENVDPERVMSWPRKGMLYPDNIPVPENKIPARVIMAQCEIAKDLLNDGADPLDRVDVSKGAVTSEKVDAIGVTYAEPASNNYSGITGFPGVDALLKPFLRGSGGKFGVVELGRG
jgi:hypothetical protein